MSGPVIGELFAGYGGLGMGVQAVLGGRIAWFSEFDKGPSKILAHRFHGIPNHGDITRINWSSVEPVDVLTGGSPCQDLSTAGKRAGMTEGTRSNLWVAMREAIAALRPSLVIWENVRGAYSATAASDLEPCAGCVGEGSGVHLRALGRVLGDLADLGYDARWHGLRAADVGAPHGRFRVFLVAHPADAPIVRWKRARASRDGWAGPADGNRSTLTVLPTPTTRDHKDHEVGPARHRPEDVDTLSRAIGALLPTPAVNDMGEGKSVEAWDEWTAKMRAKHGNGNGHGASLAIEAQRLLPTPRAGDGEKGGPNQRGSSGDLMLPSAAVRLLPTCSVADVTGGRKSRSGERADEMLLNGIAATDRWGDYADAITRWEALTRPAPAPTETGPKGSPRLAAAFSEWMMGLPAGWVTDVPGITRAEALKALGNGVVPQQCAAALRIMLGEWLEAAA